jgi:hypothetical protein
MLSLKSLSLFAAALLASAASLAASDVNEASRPKETKPASHAPKAEYWDAVDHQMLKRASDQAAKPKAPKFPAEIH